MIELKHITKKYRQFKALNDINLLLPDTGFISIVGESGSGKSTLLSIIGQIDKNYQGQIDYHGIKKDEISFIFQHFHLISFMNVNQNKQIHDYFSNKKYQYQSLYDLSSIEKLKVKKLSLGQRQRVAIERCFYHQPLVLLCDEPTASLDEENAKIVLEHLKEESKHKLVIFVSHEDKYVQAYSDEIYYLVDGEIDHKEIKNEINNEKIERTYTKNYGLKLVKLANLMVKSQKKRFIQMVLSLIFALTSILICMTLTLSIDKVIQEVIHSLFPQTFINVNTYGKKEEFSKVKDIEYVYYSQDNVMTMGLSDNFKHYQKNEVLSINSEIGYPENIIKGRKYQNISEIMLPISTAKIINQDLNKVINKKMMLYYKSKNEVKGYPVKIVGITSQKYPYTYLFLYPYANLVHTKALFHEDFKINGGLIYIRNNLKENYQLIKQNYPNYRYKRLSEEMSKQAKEATNQIQMVLLVIAMLAVLSSIFMISEVSYLNVVKAKKDFAIMRCFGAKKRDIFLLNILQAFMLHLTGFLISLGLLTLMVEFINQVVSNQGIVNFNIYMDDQLLIIAFIVSLIFVLLSSLFSLIYALKLNIKETLLAR